MTKRSPPKSKIHNKNSIRVSSIMYIEKENTNKETLKDDEVSQRSNLCQTVGSIKNYKGSNFNVNSLSVFGDSNNKNTTINELETSVSSSKLEIKKKKPMVVSISRQIKFHRYFPQISQHEIVINYFSCALMRDILLQGYLYITAEQLAFHSNVFGYVTNLVIPTCTVKSLTKKMTANIIPNAVKVITSEGSHEFVNFFRRDSAFFLMSSVCTKMTPEKIVPQSGPQPNAEQHDDSNCSLNNFETVLFNRSKSKDISTKAITSQIAKTTTANSDSVALTTIPPMAARTTWRTPDVKGQTVAKKCITYLIVFLILMITFCSIYLCYRVINIEAKAIIYDDTTTHFKLNLDGIEKLMEGSQQILDKLDKIEKLRRSLERISGQIQNITHTELD